MQGLAYTNEYKNIFSPKKTRKTASFRTNHYHNLRLVIQKLTSQSLSVYRNINKNTPEHNTTCAACSKLSTFSHHIL